MKDFTCFRSLCFRFTGKVLFVLLIYSTCIYLFIDNQFHQRHTGRPSVLSAEDLHPVVKSYLAEKVLPGKYLIDTLDCKIRKTLIMPNYYKNVWRVEKIPDCDYESSLANLDEKDQILRLNPEFQNSECCFHEILRSAPNDDNGYRLTECETFEKEINVTGKELFVIKCGNSLNFEINLPTFPQVAEKVKYWTNKAQNDPNPIEETEPYNVLVIGIDTTSRSQAMRSLPRTITQLIKMGFVDFQGYFAPHGVTEGYFVNFLMGLTYSQSRSVCKPNWTVPWDECPFIWKEFNTNNYITMYIEDGDQTFNWGGQSGFAKRPTDYYSHQLFTAMQEMRLQHSGIWNWGMGNKLDMYAFCGSNESVPEFLLRYLKRFIHKFHASPAPFFAFTWFENPFHNYEFSLGNMDQHFYSFFQSLNSLPNILDKTLIIVTADHGDRRSPFQETPEGPQERYLPPFFIRLPNKLASRHPEFVEAINWNQNRLTTAVDAHHTILHILKLSKLSFTSGDSFNQVQWDRSSLFFPVSGARSCDSINDEIRHCVCSGMEEEAYILNVNVLNGLIEYASNALNLILKNSVYAKVCEIWSTNIRSIISSKITEKGSLFSIVLFQFMANPGSARFEVKIKIFYSDIEQNIVDHFEIISDFSRISTYGLQSYCVRFDTALDKRMKELCYCK